MLPSACLEAGALTQQGTETMVCTLDDAGVLIWMSEDDSKKLLAVRAEAEKAAAAKAAEDQAAAQQAEAARVAAQKVADDAAWAAAQQAEAERVAAQKVADDAAWAAAQQAEADRLAAEQAAQQAPPIQGFVEVPTNVYYKNCTDAKNAGAAPVHVGQPGYGSHLDRDGDGIGCER